MSKVFICSGDDEINDLAIRESKIVLARKQLIVLPTDTVYGVAADAFSSQAVAVLLAAKGRGREMPPPVLISKTSTLDALAVDVSDGARSLAEAFWPGPLTLIFRSSPALDWDLGDTRGTVALRVPDNVFTLRLLSVTGPLAVSSANRSGFTAALDISGARDQLGDSVAVYLDQGYLGSNIGSTIVDVTGEEFTILREGSIDLEDLCAVVPNIRVGYGR